MKAPRADVLFRWGGIAACGVIALPMLARMTAGDVAQFLGEAGVRDPARINLAAVRWLLAAIQLALAAFFGSAFWLNTRPDAVDAPRRSAVPLLALQAALAATVPDYFFIVAAQAPFVFRPRPALVWLVVQLGFFLSVVAIASIRSATALVVPEAATLPPSVGLAVSVVYLAGWQVFAFGLGYLAASEGRSRRELERGTRELLATQQMLADSSRVAERAQIFRELHDTLGHSLAVLSVNLELASHLTNGRAGEAVGQAQTVARLLLADVRDVVHARGGDRAVDLNGALTMLAAGSHAPIVHLALPADLGVTDPSIAHAIFRCVQEAITNAVRHARARNLSVDLAALENHLIVRIRDDGQGTADLRLGRGLQGMRERLESVGGALRVESAPGHGFAIDVTVPFPEQA